MPTQLLNREVVINVGGLRIASRASTGEKKSILRVQFKVVLTTKPEPNTAEVTLYNLNEESRASLQTLDLQTIIQAGYFENISRIFQGGLDFGSSTLQGTDWVTTIQSGDGTTAIKSARINESLRGPATTIGVLRSVAGAMGLDLGNLEDKISQGSLRSIQEWTNGKVLSGRAEKVLTSTLKAMGYGWSVQSGALQILGPNEVTADTVVRLAASNGISTGLIGSPESGDNGIIKARALIQPDLLAGRKVQIESREVNGFFRIEKSTFTGDTWGNDWYSDIEAKPL